MSRAFRAAFYKGTRSGVPGIYNRAVRGWERGPYSHCEMVFSDGLSASASFMDKGVRFKEIQYDPANWDFIDLPADLEHVARTWFVSHKDMPYDLMGNLHLVIGFVPHSRNKVFCSKALGAALGIDEPWRYGPNALAGILRFINQPASAGLFLACR